MAECKATVCRRTGSAFAEEVSHVVVHLNYEGVWLARLEPKASLRRERKAAAGAARGRPLPEHIGGAAEVLSGEHIR